MWLQWVVPRLVHLSASEWAMPQAMKTLLKPCAALRRLSANWSKTELWIAGRNATFRMLLHEMTVCAVQGWTSVPPWTACCFICCHYAVGEDWLLCTIRSSVCGKQRIIVLQCVAFLHSFFCQILHRTAVKDLPYHFVQPSFCITFAENRLHLGITFKQAWRSALGLHYLCIR